MLLIPFLLLFLLLLLTLWYQNREFERGFWLKIAALYGLSVLTLNIGPIILPLGAVIGMFLVFRNKGVNKLAKRLAVGFSFAYYLLLLALPSVPLQQLSAQRELFSYQHMFREITAVYDFTEDSPVQSKSRSHLFHSPTAMTQADAIVMFLNWALTQQNIPIKDADWLWYEARQEHGFWWHFSRRDELTSHLYIRFPNQVEYFAVLLNTGVWRIDVFPVLWDRFHPFRSASDSRAVQRKIASCCRKIDQVKNIPFRDVFTLEDRYPPTP